MQQDDPLWNVVHIITATGNILRHVSRAIEDGETYVNPLVAVAHQLDLVGRDIESHVEIERMKLR